MLRALIPIFLMCLIAAPPEAAPYAELQARRPDLFDPATGFRIARQRAPTPDDIPPPARFADVEAAQALLAGGAVALDVFGASQSRFDELDGTWLVSTPRESLPGAVWLPEVGRGRLEPVMQRYLATNLKALTGGNLAQPLVVFCVADCWMSWNAAQRIAELGYTQVHWFRFGTDGWRDVGGSFEVVAPVPVDTD